MNEITPIDYCEETRKIYSGLKEATFMLAERLYNIREKQMYLGRWDSWSEFLKDSDINESSASKALQVYELYELKGGVSRRKLVEAGVEKLYTAKSLLTETNAEEITDYAILTYRDDIKDKIKGVHDCEHEFGEERYGRCHKCNSFHRVA